MEEEYRKKSRSYGADREYPDCYPTPRIEPDTYVSRRSGKYYDSPHEKEDIIIVADSSQTQESQLSLTDSGGYREMLNK
jgi:hypothetical protein